jgi:predicted RNase H-like nuclease (RuvC/YqgF family)
MSEKFDENKWRILAINKPDELHSYVPQSSINELFDEIERLEKENFRLKEANEDVQSRLDDYRQDYATVVNDQCPTDERHCGCVPILRRENRILSEDLANAKDELKHRRDALVDAQNIYNDAVSAGKVSVDVKPVKRENNYQNDNRTNTGG